MSAFTEALAPWIDQDGLVGSIPNPGKQSGGNELLETSIGCVMEVVLNKSACDVQFLKNRQMAISLCQNADGSFDKNPGRPDEITHDDLLGIACASRVCGMQFARSIVKFGENNQWVLSNTGKVYWEAIAKPWDRAIYKMCATETPCFYETMPLYGNILVDSVAGDASSHRLTWLASEALDGISPTLDACFSTWKTRMRSKYVTVGRLMSVYYKGQGHPYAVFGEKIPF